MDVKAALSPELFLGPGVELPPGFGPWSPRLKKVEAETPHKQWPRKISNWGGGDIHILLLTDSKNIQKNFIIMQNTNI